MNAFHKARALFILAGALAALSSPAYPPAPHHTIFGLVRDELGNPIESAAAEVILETASGVQLAARIVPGLKPGVNYDLAVPMDAGIAGAPYRPTALQPTVPFKIRVRIGAATYLPIEMRGDYSRLGEPARQTRLDLTLGEDADGDGLPDAWERALLASGGGLLTLDDIRPGDDFDKDGLSNLAEYISGNYAFDPKDGFTLEILPGTDSRPRLEFLAITGRTYTVLASADCRDWMPVSFAIPALGDLDAFRTSYRATDIRRVQIEAGGSPEHPAMQYYRLMVQ